MHLERITSGLSVGQETELQRLVRQLQLSDGAPGIFASVLVTPPSLDHMSLLTLYFPKKTNEYETSAEIATR